MYFRRSSSVYALWSLALGVSFFGHVWAQEDAGSASARTAFKSPAAAYTQWAATNERPAAIAYLHSVAANPQAGLSNVAVACSHLVKIYTQEKAYDKVIQIRTGQLAAEKDPSAIVSLSISIADAYVAMGDIDKAAQTLETALDQCSTPANFQLLWPKLTALYATQQDKLISLCAKRLASENEPQSLYVIASSLSAAYFAAGDYGNAVKTLDACLEKNRALIPAPSVAIAAKNLASIYNEKLNQSQEAIAVLDRELKALPAGNTAQQAELLAAQAQIYAQNLKNIAAAEDAYGKIIELDTQVPAILLGETYMNLAQILQDNNNRDKAAVLILDALKKNIGPTPVAITQKLIDLDAGNPAMEQGIRILREKIADQLAAAAAVDQYQPSIVKLLVKIGRPQEAIQEARVFLFTCSDKSAAQAVELIAFTFKNIDANLGRANAFLKYQKYGPAGEDGKLGTADDLNDFMKAISPLNDEQRAKLFLDKMNALPSDWTGWGKRGDMLLYLDKRDEAFMAYKKSFELCPMNEKDLQVAADALTGFVLRTTKDMTLAETLIQFVMFGPIGKDSREGTADDLKDPTPDILKMSQPALSADAQAVKSAPRKGAEPKKTDSGKSDDNTVPQPTEPNP